MNQDFEETYFITFTINNWIPIFRSFPMTINFIYSSLSYLTENKNVIVYAFVIMEDHMHIIWKNLIPEQNNTIINKFKKFTGKQILNYCNQYHAEVCGITQSKRKDRKMQFWKLKSKSIKVQNKEDYQNIKEYIHNNPTKGEYKYCVLPYEYEHSSSLAYFQRESNFGFLTLIL